MSFLSCKFLLKGWGSWGFYKYTAQEAGLEQTWMQMRSHFYLIYIFFATWVSCLLPQSATLTVNPAASIHKGNEKDPPQDNAENKLQLLINFLPPDIPRRQLSRASYQRK